MDDRALLGKAAAGDELAFELLVRRHTDAAWRLARSLLRDDFAADEAVQDTFVKAYRALGTFRGEAQVRTWLLSICHRTCIDRLRLKKADVVSLDEARNRRRRDEQHELRLVLEAEVAKLGDVEREAFTLVDILGYTREEAAAVVGVPASTMRSRVARAREQLARALGDEAEAGQRR